jgi:hypothetical protein
MPFKNFEHGDGLAMNAVFGEILPRHPPLADSRWRM